LILLAQTVACLSSSTQCPLDLEQITVMAWVQCPGVQKSFVEINGMHSLAIISQVGWRVWRCCCFQSYIFW